jgi:hypothetical protein
MREGVERPEYTTRQDVFFDYCLWEYRPAVPYENKFRSSNLLFHAFDLSGVDERAFDLIRRIREAVGVSRTVWGVKQSGQRRAWEFYFYDYRRRERQRSISLILDAIRPLIPCTITANENLFYFMFSIDINNDLIAGSRELDEIHMYIGNPGSTVSSGICYSLTGRGRSLENFYFFFDAKKQMEDIIAKLACSAHIDTTKIDIAQILWPELKDCKTIVVANKQKNDCIYFSRIDVDQFIFFLKRLNYDDETVSFVERNRSGLDHLLYDVGFDYRMEGRDLVILKSGYYGTF